jgi:predicted ribosome quality control (RQC) complex YloA/Tae2 family protein
MPATPTPTPKDRFTSLDTLALVRELRALGPARADKAFDLADGGWSLVFHVPGAGRRELALVPGRYAALTDAPPEHSEELSPIARELRRLLAGAVLRSVAEPGGERYLELTFSRGDEPGGLVLAVEFFGTGNLIVARGGKVAAVAHPRGWKHRSVRVGAAFERPPVRSDPWKLGRSEIEAELGRSRTDLASTLAARLSLGGPVAEEVIARAGWHGSSPAANRAVEVAPRLHEILSELVAEIGEHPRGHLYRREGLLVDATPYLSRRWEAGTQTEERASFSAAALEFFLTVAPAAPSPEESQAAKELQALERLEERQRRAVVELTDKERQLRDDADVILAHYGNAEEALAEASVPEGARELRVEIGGRTVTLQIGKTPRQSAQALYESAKVVAEKLNGAWSALQETEERRAKPLPAARIARTTSRATASKHLWFERHRWFLSSEGAVVIAGRDAPSNDLIVRRHLKDGDLYLHADLHGAASVIVKRPADGSAVGEATIREAAQWAVAFSKAWRAGLASGSAFWVTPEQVSKAASTGEFVPKGAWAIHGTKNYVRDVPLELALGLVKLGAEERWTVAPESAVRAHGRVLALLTPGEERERSDREAELVRDLGISRTVLQGLLPAGGLSIRRP